MLWCTVRMWDGAGRYGCRQTQEGGDVPLYLQCSISTENNLTWTTQHVEGLGLEVGCSRQRNCRSGSIRQELLSRVIRPSHFIKSFTFQGPGETSWVKVSST